MGQTNCRYQLQEVDAPFFYGHDLGKTAWLPKKGYLIMRKWSPRYIHIVGTHGAIYQFRLEEFHCWKSVLLTSTLHDTFWFFYPELTIDESMRRARNGQVRYDSKTSRSGYVCWGNYFEEQLIRLKENLANEEIELTDELLQYIGKELIRRKSLNEI